MSVLTAIEQCFRASEVFNKWRTSCVIITLSAIALPRTNAYWFSEISEVKTGCSRKFSICKEGCNFLNHSRSHCVPVCLKEARRESVRTWSLVRVVAELSGLCFHDLQALM